MADIYQDFPVQAPAEKVFQAISTPEGLNAWWTQRCAGKPQLGAIYVLWFGPEYDWRAKVTQCSPNREFELQMTNADDDWKGSRIAFQLEESSPDKTLVRFSHTGWPIVNGHYRISNHCWAMYLRLLRKYVEDGQVVAYEDRLDA